MNTTKRIAVAGLSALTLAAGFAGAASAQNYRGDWNRNDHRNERYDNRFDNHRGNDQWNRQWRRGERLPYGYANHYRNVDWRREHFRAPPRGYHYVRDDRGQTLLVGIATGAILGVILGNAFN
ncbi:MAG: RcnB family protein [Terricaulis sp.]